MNWTKMVLVSALAVILAIAHPDRCHAQQVALKTNLLYDATLTPNLGLEMGVGKKHSVQLFYGLNAWKFGHGEDRKYAKHWLLNPEYRYWFCHRFNGSFVGIHAFGGEYDASNVKLPFGYWKDLRDHRFEGWYIGGGISYGYQWVISKHWNLEAAIGVGAAYIKYDKFGCGSCGKKLDDGDKIYVGPTKLALSLMYLF
jgi:hypothetical protein